MGNTIVAGNTAGTSPDVSGSLTSQGHNLIGDGTGGNGRAEGNARQDCVRRADDERAGASLVGPDVDAAGAKDASLIRCAEFVRVARVQSWAAR